jgi:Flp pilus assembly pilin Flp
LKEIHPQATTSWSREAAGEDSGQDLAEYAILTALIVLVVIGVLSLVGDRIAAFYESVVGVLPFGG